MVPRHPMLGQIHLGLGRILNEAYSLHQVETADKSAQNQQEKSILDDLQSKYHHALEVHD